MKGNWVRFWSLAEPEHFKARAYCRKLMNDREEGDDLYQDALVGALTGFEHLRNFETFRPWLYRIIINQFKNRKRRQWWKRLVPLTEKIAETVSGKNPDDIYAARRRLEIAFKAVTADEQALITLFEMDGWTVAELAQLTGYSPANIKVRLHRCRNKMRHALMQYLKKSSAPQTNKKAKSEEKICAVTKPGRN